MINTDFMTKFNLAQAAKSVAKEWGYNGLEVFEANYYNDDGLETIITIGATIKGRWSAFPGVVDSSKTFGVALLSDGTLAQVKLSHDEKPATIDRSAGPAHRIARFEIVRVVDACIEADDLEALATDVIGIAVDDLEARIAEARSAEMTHE